MQPIVGEERFAQLLASGPAHCAFATRHDERSGDPLTQTEVLDALTEAEDRTGDLVTQDAREGKGHGSFVDVQVGVADAAGGHLD